MGRIRLSAAGSTSCLRFLRRKLLPVICPRIAGYLKCSILTLDELGVQLEPAKFVYDFETALIPAIQGNFPNTQVQGCFFHFCQAVLRQVGRLGLRTDYMNNQEVRKKVKMGFEILNVGTSGQVEALFQ
ncbi:hypothetical protein T06_11943 [Trichinella sp. T6]|nr:hypothetical protein T06_11943 [Trichinella sp. T6]